MIYNPRSQKWEFSMAYDFYTKQDLDIVMFKNGNDAKNKDFAKLFDQKLKL